jgi:hypothetical protein
MSNTIKAFLNSIVLQPLSFVDYDGSRITFYTWPENIDYKVAATADQLREFCEVEKPSEMRDLEIWLFNQGVGMCIPEIVTEFITHSRAEWREIVEIENPN